MKCESIIEKFCRNNSGIVQMIKTILFFGALIVFVLFILFLQNPNLNIGKGVFNSVDIVSKIILLIITIRFIIRKKYGK